MQRWPDESYDERAFEIGLACLGLMSSQERWIHRRVETVDLLRRELVRRQVTVEFTIPEPLRDDLRVGVDGPWCVPLAVLRKQPLRHFDLREAGRPVPILGQRENGPIASHLLMSAARIAVDLDEIPDDLLALLSTVAIARPDQAVEALTTLIDMQTSADARGPLARRILGDDTAGFFLATLAGSYLLIAALDDPSGRRLLKYSYDDPLELAFADLPWWRAVGQRLGWQPVEIDVEVPAATHAPSYHAEIVIPEELRVDAFIYDKVSSRLLSTDVEVGVDRASLHCPDVPASAEPLMAVAVAPERSGTPTVAVATALVTTVVLGVGWRWGELDGPTAGSSSAVLLAGSALFAGVVARGSEHRLVRDVFVGSRFLLIVVALSAMAAVMSVAFGSDDRTRTLVFGVSTAASFIATVFLLIAYFAAKPLERAGVRPAETKSSST